MSGRGRFLWYDLNTTDVEGATSFYPAVCGWEAAAWDDAPEGLPPYTMWLTGDTPDTAMGGVGPLDPAMAEHTPPHWMGYVYVEDVDGATRRAVELGGGVMSEPMDLPSVGRISVIRDPQGAAISLFTPTTPPPAEHPVRGPGHVSWHELMTTDSDAALGFYRELLGWEKTSSIDMGEGTTYDLFSVDGDEIGGVMPLPKDMEGVPPHWCYYVRVNDLDGALETVRDSGGEVLFGPMEVPGGDHVAQCRDPQGAVFALHEPKGAAQG